MERLLTMLGVIGGMYVLYAISMGRWQYNSPAVREKRNTQFKKDGMSDQFSFVNPYTLWVLNLASAGTFTFYWLYKQWKVIRAGFKRTSRVPLKINATFRAILGVWSFLALGNLVNRTCEYTHHRTSFPAVFWWAVWLAGPVLLLLPTSYGWKIAGYLIFCTVPVIFQRRINTLTRDYLPLFPRAIELAATLIGAAVVVVCVLVWKFLLR